MKFFLSILCINVFICFSVYAKKEKSVGWAVSYQDSDFVNAQNQDTLTYINPEDDILGRSLVDRNDISDDYQMHVIYVLAKNSEDKQFDVNGKIEEVILKSQEDLQEKINKKFKYDMTKEGKIDISFLRVDKTADEIDYLEPHPVHYFFIQIAKNGFYHPKKIYTVFYQEDFYQKDQKQKPGGASFTSTLETPTGDIFVPLAVIFMKEAMKHKEQPIQSIYLHEMFHSLGFIQQCSKGAARRDFPHIKYKNDYMGDGNYEYIDKKNNTYYNHSNSRCPLDLKKNVYLEPIEKNIQILPFKLQEKTTKWVKENTCVFDWSLKKYNHEVALVCAERLNF